MGSYFKLPKNEKRLFREALILIYITKVQLTFSTFKKYSERLISTGEDNNHPKEELELIRLAIIRTRKVAFWKNQCLVNTLTARKMLNKRNVKSIAYLTLHKNNLNDSLKAHAWIESNNISIVFPEPEYVTVYSF